MLSNNSICSVEKAIRCARKEYPHWGVRRLSKYIHSKYPGWAGNCKKIREFDRQHNKKFASIGADNSKKMIGTKNIDFACPPEQICGLGSINDDSLFTNILTGESSDFMKSFIRSRSFRMQKVKKKINSSIRILMNCHDLSDIHQGYNNFIFNITDPFDTSGYFFESPKISVRPSIIASGLGVFADEFIPCGTPVTMYPHHARLLNNKKCQYLDSFWHLGPTRKERRVYSFGVFKGVICNIIGSPHLIEDTNMLGHMLNDPSGDLIGLDEMNMEKKKTMIDRYYDVVKSRANVTCWISEVSQVILYTTRDINADEELLMPYGAHYWAEKNKTVDDILGQWPESKNKELSHSLLVKDLNFIKPLRSFSNKH